MYYGNAGLLLLLCYIKLPLCLFLKRKKYMHRCHSSVISHYLVHPSYLFHCYYKRSWLEKLKEERVYLALTVSEGWNFWSSWWGTWHWVRGCGPGLVADSSCREIQPGGRKCWLANCMAFWNIKAHSEWHPLQQELPPNTSQIIPPARDQVFKDMSLWGPFSYKPPVLPCQMISDENPLTPMNVNTICESLYSLSEIISSLIVFSSCWR